MLYRFSSIKSGKLRLQRHANVPRLKADMTVHFARSWYRTESSELTQDYASFFRVNKTSFHSHAHVGIEVVLPEHCASLSGHPGRYSLGISQCTLKIDKTYEAHSRYNSRCSTGKRKRKIRLYVYLSHMTLFLSSIIGNRILDCYFGHNTVAVTESPSICNLVFFTFH